MSVVSSLFGGGSKKPEPTPTPAPISVQTPAPSSPMDKEALKRAGRASLLISTSSQGVLGNPKTGRQSLLST